MSYSVTVNDPGLPEGTEIQIKGLEPFENGETREVTDEEHDLFRRINATTVTNDDGVNELQLGPSLDDANLNEDVFQIGGGKQKPQAQTSSSTPATPKPATAPNTTEGSDK